MTAATQIINAFRNLPDEEKRTVLSALIRISRDLASRSVSAEEMAADELFLLYDLEESVSPKRS